MAEEGEVEMIDSGGADPANHNSTSSTGILVEVAFQKNPYQKNKYLEAEPKALGITQIMLTLFIMSVRFTSWQIAFQMEEWTSYLICGIFVLFGLIAGGVAIGAQNLHLPTLKACLGLQIVMCVMSVLCFIDDFEIEQEDMCWNENNATTSDESMCHQIQTIFDHVTGLEMLMLAAQISLSATLAAFCCKVVQCCSPRTSVPVITVNTARASQ